MACNCGCCCQVQLLSLKVILMIVMCMLQAAPVLPSAVHCAVVRFLLLQLPCIQLPQCGAADLAARHRLGLPDQVHHHHHQRLEPVLAPALQVKGA